MSETGNDRSDKMPKVVHLYLNDRMTEMLEYLNSKMGYENSATIRHLISDEYYKRKQTEV